MNHGPERTTTQDAWQAAQPRGGVIMAAIVWAAVALLVILVAMRRRGQRRRGGVGSAAVGAVYGFLNEDKRNAVELIVEERAEARDPERAAGNLPDLEHPRGTPRG
jgi:hypothetical protein